MSSFVASTLEQAELKVNSVLVFLYNLYMSLGVFSDILHKKMAFLIFLSAFFSQKLSAYSFKTDFP